MVDLGIGGLGFATEIGAGASAIVYKARQLDLDREVAVKVLKVTDEAFIRRFKREAKTLGKLSQNPGIVTVYDTGVTSAGQPYLILELCESSVLDHLNSAGTFEPLAACHAAAQVADAVADAHDNGVVHRDIKPGNVLLSQTGRYMVTDFGISTVTGATMGQTNSVGFTAGYVAPETLTGEEVGAPSDVYAVGATLFHMLAGRAPFVDPEQNSNLLALAQRVVKDPIPDLREQGVPAPVFEIVEAAMAKKPDQRPTAAELRDRLLAVAGVPAPVMTNAGNADAIDSATAFSGGIDPVTVAVNEADLNEYGSPQSYSGSAPLAGSDPTVGMPAVSQRAGPAVVQPNNPGTYDSGAQPPPSGGSMFERGILSDLPAEPRPIEQTPEERRYQYTSDDRRQLGPLLVGALVGLIALIGVGALLISQSGGDDGNETGDGNEVSAVGGPGTSLDGNGNESTGQQNGNQGTLDPNSSQNSTSSTDLPGTITVPRVIGASATLAESRLRALGFRVNLVDEESSTVPVGDVIRQSPSGGLSAEKGDVVSIYVSTREPVKTVAVPNVAGMSESAATAQLTAADLTVSVRRELSLTVAKDEVIGTTPDNGTTVNVESSVTLIISDGPPECASFEGTSALTATSQLEALGLTVTSTSAFSDSVARGVIISCTLTPTTATLVVSSGTDPCTALIGTNHIAATATLEGLGLTVSETAVPSNDVAIGEVVTCTVSGSSATVTWADAALPATCPASVVGSAVAAATTALQGAGFTDIEQNQVAGTEAAGTVTACTVSGSTATLTVSTGPADVIVPDVSGLTVAAAGEALVGAGLRRAPSEQVDSNRPAGEVIGARPAIGAAVPADTLVTLLVSKGPAALVAVPPVVGLSQTAAVAAITGAGLVPAVVTQTVADGSANIGLVISAAPIAGRMVADGSTVTITVGAVAPDP